jgi:hypothetical protein
MIDGTVGKPELDRNTSSTQENAPGNGVLGRSCLPAKLGRFPGNSTAKALSIDGQGLVTNGSSTKLCSPALW